MNYKKIVDDAKSENRLRDLLEGPHANDWRYYRNQLNKCAEDKKRERVQTWYSILLEEKPEFAKNIEVEFKEYLSDEQEQGRQQREDEKKREAEEQAQKERAEHERAKNHDKQLNELYQFICQRLYQNDRFVEVARRSPRWNSYGGRIGSYSHSWSAPSGKTVKDIDRYLDRYDWNSLIANISWDGGYDHDFGIEYSGGEVWKPISKVKYLNGGYDSDESCTIYKVKRCPQSLIKKISSSALEKFDALYTEDIERTINSIVL